MAIGDPEELQPSLEQRRVGAAAFIVLQLAEIVFPAFGIGDDGLRVLVREVRASTSPLGSSSSKGGEPDTAPPR